MPQGKGGLLGLLTTRAWYVYFKFDSSFIVHLVFSFVDFSVHSWICFRQRLWLLAYWDSILVMKLFRLVSSNMYVKNAEYWWLCPKKPQWLYKQ